MVQQYLYLIMDTEGDTALDPSIVRAIQAANSGLLSSIERVIEEKIGSKTKNEQKFVFKRKGNETQFHVNYTVGEHLSAATSRLDSIMPENEENAYSLKRARDEIGDAMDALEHRNKMVKLADMSDSGWAVVNRV